MIFSNKLTFAISIPLLCLIVVSCQSIKRATVNVGEALGSETLVKAAADLTPRQEYFLGRSIMARALTERPAHNSENLQTYINQLGQYLALHSTRTTVFKGYRFVVTDDSLPVAMSAPGGFVLLSIGMMKSARNEDEMAAILAHEIGHVALKHHEENIKAANQMAFAKSVLQHVGSLSPNSAMVSAFSEAVASGVDIAFNKGQERDADDAAIEILIRAGYAPNALQKVIERIPNTATLLSKHPRNQSRIDRLEEKTYNKRNSVRRTAAKRFLAVLENEASSQNSVR
ncbi:MAG: M48 family metalloprotease [Silvanigrellaceae bacterium]